MTSSTTRIATVIVFSAALALLPAVAAGQTGTTAEPSPPPDSIVEALIRLIESGNASDRGAFITKAFTPRAVAADSARFDRFLLSLHEQGAPFELSRTEKSGRHALASLGSPRTRRAATLIVSTDRADPTRLGGSFVQQVDGHLVVGHGGGGTGSGMDNGFRQFADGRYTVVVLSNIDPPTATRITSALVKLLAARPDG